MWSRCWVFSSDFGSELDVRAMSLCSDSVLTPALPEDRTQTGSWAFQPLSCRWPLQSQAGIGCLLSRVGIQHPGLPVPSVGLGLGVGGGGEEGIAEVITVSESE